MENRRRAVGNCAEWELLNILRRKRGRKRKASCKKVRVELQPFFIIGNDGRAVQEQHGFDPLTTPSREKRVPGHMSWRPSDQHTLLNLHTYKHTRTHLVLYMSAEKKERKKRLGPQRKFENYHTFPLLHVNMCQLCNLQRTHWLKISCMFCEDSVCCSYTSLHIYTLSLKPLWV